MDLGNVHIIRNTFGGKVVQQFVTKPCRKIGICTVFCYEGGGSENPEIVLRIMWMLPLGDAGLENLDNFPRIFPKESKKFQGSFRKFPTLPQSPMNNVT
jgi:hypothetical protein